MYETLLSIYTHSLHYVVTYLKFNEPLEGVEKTVPTTNLGGRISPALWFYATGVA